MNQPSTLSPETLARIGATFPFEFTNADDAVNGILDKLQELQQRGPESRAAVSLAKPRTDQQAAGALHDFVVNGDFQAGDELRWERPKLGKTHVAHVNADGCIVTEDGRAHAYPTNATSHLAPGQQPHPWEAWIHVPSGRSLSDWREEYRRRKESEIDHGSATGRPREWTEIVAIALERLPYGAWTTYGDLGRLTGRHPKDIGGFLARAHELENAWRVLLVEGKVSPSFAWSGVDRGDVHELLRNQGVRFSPGLVADRTQRMHVEDLRKLLAQ